MPHCPMCNGPGAKLGNLGWMHWFRCIDCGWDFSIPSDALAEELDDADYDVEAA